MNPVMKEFGKFLLHVICGICAIFLGLAIWMQHLYEPYYVIRLMEFILFTVAGISISIIAYVNLMKTALKHWKKPVEA